MFLSSVVDLYITLSLTLFAVETRGEDGRIVKLNPGPNYRIHAGDVGFLLAPDETFRTRLTQFYRLPSVTEKSIQTFDSGDVSVIDVLHAPKERPSTRPVPVFNLFQRLMSTAGQGKAQESQQSSQDPSRGLANRASMQSQFSSATTSQMDGRASEVGMLSTLSEGSESLRSPSKSDLLHTTYHLEDDSHSLPDLEARTLEYVEFSGHIIVCGSLRGLQHFLYPLRLRSLACIVPIVILHPSPPSDEDWQSIAPFPNVYYVRGSPLKLTDLRHAGVARCDTIVVFLGDRHDPDDLLADADAIFICKSVESRFANVVPMIELAHGGNIELFSQKDNWQNARMQRMRKLLNDTGLTFQERWLMLNRISKEYSTNPSFGKSLSRIVTSERPNSQLGKTGLTPFPSYHFEPYFASGHIFTVSIVDSLLSQEYYKPFMLTIVQLLACGLGSEQGSSLLLQIPMVPGMEGKTYQELFVSLCNEGIVALGLYRCSGTYGSPQPYVYTNCQPTSVLNSNDRIFVLALDPSHPRVAGAKGLNTKNGSAVH